MKSLRRGSGNRVIDEPIKSCPVGESYSVDSYPMTDSVVDLKDSQIEFDDLEFTDYELHFENLVFEGGGNKGLAYIGAIMVG